MSKSLLKSNFFHKKSLLCLGIVFLTLRVFSTINVITPLPTNITKCQGDSLMLSISATSDSMLEYSWKRNGSPVGSNSPIFMAGNLSLADTGTYTCEIKEIGTSNVDIQTCHVVVNLKPIIVQQPTGGISPLCEGSTINLTVDIQNATMVWKRGGTVLSTGSPNYTKTNIGAADSGYYYVLGRALIGCRDTMTDSFFQVVRLHGSIITQPASAQLRDQSGMSHVMRVMVAGDGPFAYQWYKNGSIIAGANSDSLKIYSFTTAGDSGSYRVIVNTTTPCNDTLTSGLALVQPTLCPIILSQPDTVINGCIGGTVNLEVKALGVGRYQWFRTGIGSSTSDSLEYAIYPRFTITKLDSTGIGYYNLVTYREAGADPTCNEKTFKRVLVKANPRPIITLQPMPNKNCHATTHTMTVNAMNKSGYRWYKNDSMIAGAMDSFYTVTGIDLQQNFYKVHAINPYCTDEPSNSVLIRQVNPNKMVALATGDRLNLKEQCTDSLGWSYYAHESNVQEMLLGIKKGMGDDTIRFSPDVKLTNGYIKELMPATIESKGILMGLRMFNVKVDSTQKISKPYAVKFFYNKGSFEKQLFLSTIGTRINNGNGLYTTNLPLNELSFITSTQAPMDTALLNLQSAAPLAFNNTIVSDKYFGEHNNIEYVAINNLVATNGGGTFYFHYFLKNSTNSIASSASSQGITIYPNPTSGRLNIELSKSNQQVIQITISDYLGREIKKDHIAKFQTTKSFDYSDLPAGNYILRVDNGTEIVNEKLTIAK